MSSKAFYPKSPESVPSNLTQANASYKRQATLAMLGLMLFMLLYFALAACFAWISYSGVMAITAGTAGLPNIIVTLSSILLTVFLLKAMFSVRKSGDPRGLEVTKEDEPRLFEFLHSLADEIGAPKPHRVFITPEVNAAVFYDLSLLNFIFPSKKNLIVGLGLVNVLTLSELKAVLAHEFGHFAQGSMLVGRWVYIAQQIITHMVATRDWLDSIVRFVSRIDLRIAWIGWILALILWSIRSLMDTLFSLVIMAERALSREMEFNADLVAVSVTGSDALVNALHKLQAADHAWQTALDVARTEASSGNLLEDLFRAQKTTIDEMRRVLNDQMYGVTPSVKEGTLPAEHRVFEQQSARPPQMWATHPANSDREDNAKANYIPAVVDERDAWEVFANPVELRKNISLSFYNAGKTAEMETVSPAQAVLKRFDKSAYASEYRGAYLNRSAVRYFASVSEMLSSGDVSSTAADSIAKLYPKSIAADLDAARNLNIERETLEALQRGDLKPSGGVIRHRGEELSKAEIPDAIQVIVAERKVVADRLKAHDASCRRAHLMAAKELGNGWEEYLISLIELLHCSEHILAKVKDEQALFINTWQVITADGQIGYFEKRRMIGVCKNVHKIMNDVVATAVAMDLPETVAGEIQATNWAEQFPTFNLNPVDKRNWADWCKVGAESMDNIVYALGLLQNAALEELINTESTLSKSLTSKEQLEAATKAGKCPDQYHILLPGDENELQRKLDLWNRFQLAHGFMPTLARLTVSLGIVGGTIYSGLALM